MKIRIYYFDTDCGGVVYYGNYLKFLEMARTDYMEKRGLSLKALMDADTMFVVYKQEITYKAPVRYGDIIEIDTKISDPSDIQIELEYTIKNQRHAVTTQAKTTLVCVDGKLIPKILPKDVREKLLLKV